jgi:hypothetical protein
MTCKKGKCTGIQHCAISNDTRLWNREATESSEVPQTGHPRYDDIGNGFEELADTCPAKFLDDPRSIGRVASQLGQ